MKRTIALMALTLLVGMHAFADAPVDTQVFCRVFATSKEVGHDKFLFQGNVTLKEQSKLNDLPTVEVYRSASAVYRANIVQHWQWNDGQPELSTLILTVSDAQSGKTVARGSAHWPRQASRGELVGLTNLEVSSAFAEPNFDEVLFSCDARQP